MIIKQCAMSHAWLSWRAFVEDVKVLRSFKHVTGLEPILTGWGEQEKIIAPFFYLRNGSYVFRKKSKFSDLELKELTCAYLDKNFPAKEWIRVYTDGSAEEAVTNGGSGVYIEMPNQETIESSIPTGTHCSNYKAELEAIKEALTILERITPSIPKARAVLLSDSKSVLEKLEDLKGEERQHLAKCLGNVVRNTESLVLQWIPAHCRIEGNERADRLAKEGSVLEQIESDLTYREVKSIIKTSLNKAQDWT
ncbi:hypothetical protein EGW08_005592 [Elysia chlorotica]|uniref:ribonuclease H n=1 Tax=Elysia chlorotica TaxID=188477 RepID=A0A3S1BR16_ELYCH|nr:hypothetical protein EGW08_005592 [Elysia chlorotica]